MAQSLARSVVCSFLTLACMLSHVVNVLWINKMKCSCAICCPKESEMEVHGLVLDKEGMGRLKAGMHPMTNKLLPSLVADKEEQIEGEGHNDASGHGSATEA